jgi:hypothetical protein
LSRSTTMLRLPKVVVPEMQALLRRRHISAERPDSPRRFAFRRLDLYDVGAQACEHPAGILSRLVGKLEHSDAVEIGTLVPATCQPCASPFPAQFIRRSGADLRQCGHR